MICNRRHFARYVTNSPIPVCLEATSGILCNLGEGGLAADVVCQPDTQVIAIGFGSADQRIEANAQVVWRDDLKSRVGLKFVGLSQTSRQQVKKLLSRGLIGDTSEAGIATKQGLGEPKSTKPLFTLSSLATSEEVSPLRDTLRIEEADDEDETLERVQKRRGPHKLPRAGWICLGSLLLVALVALFLFPDTIVSLWSDLTSTNIDSFSSSAADPPSSPDSPMVSAPSVATVPAAASVSPARPPTVPPPSDATRIARIEVFRTHKQTNVRVRGNGPLPYQASRLDNPERLVLDFSGVRLGPIQTLVPSHYRPVQRIRVGQFKPDVARVVIDLEGAVPYRMKSDDHSLTVAFTPPGFVPKLRLSPIRK